jgi:hypothetical protein
MIPVEIIDLLKTDKKDQIIGRYELSEQSAKALDFPLCADGVLRISALYWEVMIPEAKSMFEKVS